MTIIQAILMGLVQGLTEFLPVSSSGHLALFKILFKVNTDTGLLFDVMLHIGTLVAIFIAFYKDVFRLIVEGFKLMYLLVRNFLILIKNLTGADEDYDDIFDDPYRRFVMLIIVATIPTGILGIVGKDFVESASESLLIPGICLIITAVLLFISDRIIPGTKNARNATFLNAFEVGMVQGIATLPGISRSGSTIAACLLCGFNKKFAVKFSFLMSIPAVLGAALLEIKDIKDVAIVSGEISSYIVGTIVATVVGYIAIKTMLVVIKKNKFTIFSIYCLAVGALCIAGHFFVLK